MKRRLFWDLKGDPHNHYTEQPVLVINHDYNAIKVLYPDGSVKASLAEWWETIDQNQQPVVQSFDVESHICDINAFDIMDYHRRFCTVNQCDYCSSNNSNNRSYSI